MAPQVFTRDVLLPTTMEEVRQVALRFGKTMAGGHN